MLDEEDARLEHEMIMESLDHLWPWFPFRDQPPTLADRVDLAARQRAEAVEGTSATYLVLADEWPVGKVWLDVSGLRATTGWYLRASATGQGYATEAVRALSDLAFDLGLERLEAHTDSENRASRALAERTGFVLEAILPGAHLGPDGARRAECVYVLVRPSSAPA
jgi:RimJ/RimL family protein N-acetyltransferase